MSDAKRVPEPTAEDMRLDLYRLYPHFAPSLAGSTQSALIRRCAAAERKQDAFPGLVVGLETAVRWLRRLEQEHPGCLNEDAIEKHLIPALSAAR